MNIIKIIFIAFALTTTLSSKAQKWEKSIKLNNQSTFYKQTESITLNQSGSRITSFKKNDFLKPTFAFRWLSKETHWAHEIELTTLSWNKDEYVEETIDQNGTKEITAGNVNNYGTLICRYDIRYQHKIKKAPKITLEIGGGGQPFYYWSKVNPLVSQSFPSRFQSLGLRAYLVPGVSYLISKKCYLNLNLPIDLMQFSLNNQIVQNPSFTSQQQRTTTFNYESFEQKICLRMGIGINL